MITNSSLVEMEVYHKRHRPTPYDFSHKVLYLILKLDNDISSKLRLFSVNKLNFFSLFWKDYGLKVFDNPATYFKQILEDFKIKPRTTDNMFLLTMPKILCFGFNPVSFWLCFNAKQSLYAVLAEVNNTFGERHSYLCFNQNMEPISKWSTINHPKVFHVSPFCKVTGHYEFRFEVNAEKIKIDIDYFDNSKKLITTSIKGNIQELVDKNLVKYLFLLPFMAIKVLFLIHYHALRLWLKRVPYIRKPAKSDIDIT